MMEDILPVVLTLSSSDEMDVDNTNYSDDELLALSNMLFYNSLFWKHLSTFLNFTDLKILRVVCQNFNIQVLTESKLRDKAVLKLTGSSCHSSIFGTITDQWKHFKIELCPPRTNVQMEWLYPLLSSAESMVLYLEEDNRGKPLYPPMVYLLTASSNLKKLSIDTNLLCGGHQALQLFKTALESKKCLEILGKLQEFEIINNDKYWGRKPVCCYGPYIEANYFVRITDLLGPTMKNLKTLKVEQVVDQDDYSQMLHHLHDHDLHLQLQYLTNIPTISKNHLTSLDLYDMQLWCTSSIFPTVTTMIFPSLKSVNIRADDSEAENIYNFLNQQPFLEHLAIKIHSVFPNKLFNLIREKSTNLKSLQIHTRKFEDEQEKRLDFLRELKFLQEFSWDLSCCSPFLSVDDNANTHNNVLSCLPGSIKKIYLRDLPDRVQSVSPVVWTQINPFKLTQLAIIKCQNIVDDEIMQFFCQHFTMLQSLELSRNHRVTDFGFTGIRQVEEGVVVDPNVPTFSLQNLKGLKKLVISGFASITKLTCFHIQFKELKYLDLSDNFLITEDGTRSVVKTNPSLEHLITWPHSRSPSFEQLITSHPRLKTFDERDLRAPSDDDDVISCFDPDFDNEGFIQLEDFPFVREDELDGLWD